MGKTIGVRAARGTVAFSTALLVLTAGSALAEEIWWNAPSGGLFNTDANWDPAQVPGPDDVAIFDLGEDPAYTVTFDPGIDITNSQCTVRLDKVDMALSGVTYALSGSLIVGEFNGDSAELGLIDGTVDADVVQVGLWGDSAGVLEVGAGMTMNTGSLGVANDGDGNLTITDGGVVTGDYCSVAAGASSVGVLDVTGPDSTVTLTYHAWIGDSGDGTLNISDGAQVQAGGEFTMGVDPDSTGDVTVSGAGSTLEAASWMTVGSWGSGTMQVDSGAAVTAGYYCGLGGQADGTGVIDVTGPGSTLTVTQGLYMGGYGNGTLNVTDGAHVATLAGLIQVGALQGSQGEVLVDGAGSLLDSEAAAIVVGDSGQGSLSITNGAHVHSLGELFVGNATDSVGEVLVSGDGSTYRSDSGYASIIGNEGEGTLMILDGGYVETNGGLIIGNQPQLGGTVTLSGVGSSTLKVPWLLVGNESPGKLKLEQGCPRVAVGDVDPQTIPARELHIGPNGVLKGNGTVVGNVVNLAGVVDPGGDDDPVPTPGLLHITGDFDQRDGGTLWIELGGTVHGSPNGYSALDVTGDVILGGELQVLLVNSFDPQLGDTFDILDWGTIDGEFDELFLPELTAGLEWDSGDLYTTGEIAVVPEPTTLLLFAVGSLAVTRRRWG